MSDLRRGILALAVMAFPAAGAGTLIAACGGDDTGAGGGDASPDSTEAAASNGDGTVAEGASLEGSADTGSSDTGVGAETANSDGPGGGGPDGSATGDGAVDNSALYAYPGQVAAATCQSFESCCRLDAGTFDNAKCISQQMTEGPGRINADTNLLDGGHVTFDPDAGARCLARIQNVDCTANSLTEQQYSAMLSDCFAALQGTLKAGEPCNGSIECAPGNFCDPYTGDAAAPADAAPSIGTCAPLRTQGQPCGNLGVTNCNNAGPLEQSACSYRASGNTGLSCVYLNFSTFNCLDAAAWSCQPQQADAGQCVNDVDCKSSICDPNKLVCVNAKSWIDPTLGCPALTIKDAGPG